MVDAKNSWILRSKKKTKKKKKKKKKKKMKKKKKKNSRADLPAKKNSLRAKEEFPAEFSGLSGTHERKQTNKSKRTKTNEQYLE